MKEWKSSNSNIFLVLSGNWMKLIGEYKEKYPKINIKVFTIHLDTDRTPSWHNYLNQDNLSEDIWIYDKDKVNFIIDKSFMSKEIFDKDNTIRPPKVYIHGGGWGMGTYQDQYEEFMKNLPYSVKTTVHDVNEIIEYNNWEYYLMDPVWKPWEINKNEKNLYPRMFKIKDEEKIEIDNAHHNGIYNLYKDVLNGK